MGHCTESHRGRWCAPSKDRPEWGRELDWHDNHSFNKCADEVNLFNSMKKLLIALSIILFPVMAHAFTASWNATSSTGTTISPDVRNGKQQAVQANYFIATSTTATSTFANGINATKGCFAINSICVNGTSASPAGSNTQVQYNNLGAFGASANLNFGSNILETVGKIRADNSVNNISSGVELDATDLSTYGGTIRLRGDDSQTSGANGRLVFSEINDFEDGDIIAGHSSIGDPTTTYITLENIGKATTISLASDGTTQLLGANVGVKVVPKYDFDVSGVGHFSSFVDAHHFVATSTTASSFPYASTTAISVSGLTSGRCVQTSTGGLLTATGSACGAGAGTVTSVATNNGLTGGTITTSGTLGLDISKLSTNALITWNGSQLAATGTQQLTVGFLTATTSTATSTFAGDLAVGATTTPVKCDSTSSFCVDYLGHQFTGGTAPTCGTGCSTVIGDDSTMRVTTGSGITSATVNFANTWKNSVGTSITPSCVANEESAGVTTTDASSTPTTVVLEFASALTTKLVTVQCRASVNFTF